MTTSFRIGVDWRRKGFFCWDAQAGDALNELPTPITYTSETYSTDGGSITRQPLVTDFSRIVLEMQTGSNVYAGLRLGVNAHQLTDYTNYGAAAGQGIPVTGSTQYTVSVQVQGLDDAEGDPTYTGVPFQLLIYGADSSSTSQLATQAITVLSENWTEYQITFTTRSTDNRIAIALYKNNNSANVKYRVGGVMLVEGSSVPSGYNAGDALDLYDNISTQVLDASWLIGTKKAYQDVGNDPMLTLKLDNSDKRFSPEYSSSPLYEALAPLRPVTLQSDDGTDVRTHFTGWLESITPDVNQYGERRCTVTCAGPMLFFERAQTEIEVQENKRTDEIITRLLDEVTLPPTLAETSILWAGGINLDEVVLPPEDWYIDIETGLTTLQFAADNWIKRNSENSNFEVYRALRDTTAAERGRFFFDREGQCVFWNRHHLILDENTPTSINNSMTNLSYSYAALSEFANEIWVTSHPRKFGSATNDLLYEYALEDGVEGIVVAPGEEKVINISYRDVSENQVGARDVYLDNINWSYGVWYTSEEWSGPIAAYDGHITFEPKATGATLRVRAHNRYAHLRGYEVRGQIISDFGQMDATAQDHTSITKYGKRTLTLNYPTIEDLNMAQYIADYELLRRKQPAGRVSAVTVVSHGMDGGDHHAQQLALTIGSLITIQEAQSAHNTDYVVIGESHQLSAGGTHWETTWYLEALDTAKWAIFRTSGATDEIKLADTTETAIADAFVLAY